MFYMSAPLAERCVKGSLVKNVSGGTTNTWLKNKKISSDVNLNLISRRYALFGLFTKQNKKNK